MKILATLCKVTHKKTGHIDFLDESVIDGIAYCGMIDSYEIEPMTDSIDSTSDVPETPEQKPPRFDLRNRPEHKTVPDLPKPKINCLKTLTGK